MRTFPTNTQKEAIEEIKHNLLVISGPGTGKTSIISCKVAFLLDNGFKPEEILVTTFTNKATDELKLRIAQYCKPYGIYPHHLQVYTIHGFCWKLIKEYAYIFDPHTDFLLLSDIEQKFLILKHYSDFGITEDMFTNKEIFYNEVFNLFGMYGALNEHLIEPKDLKSYIEKTFSDSRHFNHATDKGILLKDSEIYSIFMKYRQFMWKNKYLDHSQTLKLVYTLLKKHENIKKAIQKRYKYILVDEYQDTSLLQHEIFKLLVGDSNKICAVGDDDQGIYQFRGASVHNLLNFHKDFTSVKTIHIGENFRSTDGIVNFAHEVIRENKNRFDKNLASKRGTGSEVMLLQGESPRDTAGIICQTIKNLMENQSISNYSDIAILFSSVRWGFIGTGFKEVFDREGIPCVLHRSGNFFDHNDINFFFELLGILINNRELSFEQFNFILEKLFLEKCNITSDSFNLLLENSITVFSLEDFSVEKLKSKYSIVHPGDIQKISSLYNLYKKINDSSKRNIIEILYELFELTNYMKRVFDFADQKSLYQVAYLTQLAQSHEKWSEISIKSFVQNLLIFKEKRTLEEVSIDDLNDGVDVTTIHNVKGLQYKAVFVCEFDPYYHHNSTFQIPEALLKNKNSADLSSAKEALENKLRLLYVGLTRAKDYLFLAYSKMNKNGYRLKPKPFLEKAIQGNYLSKLKIDNSHFSSVKSVESEKENIATVTISYSGINSYLSCPLRYQLEHVYHFATPQNKDAVFGTIIHAVLEKLHIAHLRSQKMIEEDIVDIFEHQLRSKRIYSKEEFIETKKIGLDILSIYINNHLPAPSEILEIEKEFEVFIGVNRLVGVIDLILKNEDSTMKIIDFKTGKMNETIADQLLTYAFAYQLENNVSISCLEAHFLREDKTISYPVDQKKLDQIKDKITNTLERIANKEFSPTSSSKSCSICPFSKCCGYAPVHL